MIAISILKIQEDIQKITEIDQSNTDFIHLDVMDGKFVSNVTNYQKLPNFSKRLDIHFMVEDVKKYVDEYQYLKPEYITFHVEVNENIEEIIQYIKSKNIKVGLSLKPNTPINAIIPYLDDIDLVLIMTVEPGAGGQLFMRDMIPKIKEAKKLQCKRDFLIEVDGGINDQTISLCEDADIFVVGSYITDSNNPNEKIKKIKGM